MTNDILSRISQQPDNPNFFTAVFTEVVKDRKAAQAKDGDNLKRVCAEEYNELSKAVDRTGIQDSASVRNVLRTRRLANLLVNDKGEILFSLIPRIITQLKKHLYSLGPNRQFDSERQEHVLTVLAALQQNTDLQRLLKQMSKPYLHTQADQVIRDTLQLPAATSITDAHAKRAALAAWMCTLRQSIGSCFATAPAIVVHQEQPELFLTDLIELLGTGRMKRTFGGIEHSVPMNTSWGAGDLRRQILISLTNHEQTAIWHSPGYLNSLEAAELFSADLPTTEKIQKAKEITLQTCSELNVQQPSVVISLEELLKRILMHHLNITDSELEAYDSRPKAMIHSGLLLQMPISGSGMGGKGESCAQFYQLLERASSAFKALSENALLKTWEYTLASFAETKSDFTRWNLYFSLGLRPDDPGGIGEALFAILKRKLDEANQKFSDLQFEYEQLFPQIKQLEVRIRHAATDSEAQWIRAEYQSKASEFQTLEEMRDQMRHRAERFANLFDMLIEKYDKLFPQYFQEVYDPDLHEVQTGPYDDSPAGFRLLYKHGRANTSQWTKIKTPQEFVEALAKFFTTTESEIVTSEEFEGLNDDVVDITTAVVTHVRSHEFLESAFHRMAIAHRMQPIENPLENLQKIPVKPWAYISGGTMGTLVSNYFRREQKPSEVSRWVENPMELLVFLIDTVKHIPYSQMDAFLKSPNKALLMHSPTHAFLLKPGMAPFKDSWQTDAYTYTWVRDHLVRPMEQFVNSIELDEESMAFIIEKLAEQIPIDFQHYFKRVFAHIFGKLSVPDFRFYILDHILHERGLQYSGRGVLTEEELDSVFYSLLPLFPRVQLVARLNAIWSELPAISNEMQNKLRKLSDEVYDKLLGSRLLSSQNLIDLALAIYCIASGATSSAQDVQKAIVQAAQNLGFAMPFPIMFADTNWNRNLFAFVINPATQFLELWRMDPLGRAGAPMISWREWLNGIRKEPTWGIYTHPHEYTGNIPMQFKGTQLIR